jgi:DNA-binding response OmpR family regulator
MQILIVEDEDSLMESMVSYLELEGFRCERASDYHTAVCVLDKHDYICMLIDLNLPGGDGMELVKLARRRWTGAGKACQGKSDRIRDHYHIGKKYH